MYEIRWSNGCWKLFNTERYTAVAAFGIKREADAALARVMSK